MSHWIRSCADAHDRARGQMKDTVFHPGYFITGTDTGVGKTFFACALLRAFADAGLSTAAMKPISAGCRMKDGVLENDDALALQDQSSVSVSYATLNPYAFEPAIAPHIAAQDAGVQISIAKLRSCFRAIAAQAEVVVVEGAGGWLVPISGRESMADLARSLEIPVILVVGMRLGCLNHALLSARQIENDGCRLIGWVANSIDSEFACAEENHASLCDRLDAPLIANLPYSDKPFDASTKTKISLDFLRLSYGK